MQEDRPSNRIVEQRLRNRAMEALEALSEGDAGVQSVGVVEYVEQFFDVINDDNPPGWRGWSCFTTSEVQALDQVHGLLTEACVATPQMCSDDEFIESGWPATIQPSAVLALNQMRARGRFSEDVEQDHPSQ